MATVAPAGRGHARFLETLIINKLHFTPRGRVPPLIAPFIPPLIGPFIGSG